MAIEFYNPVKVDFTRSEYIKVNAKQYDSETRYLNVTCYNDGVLYRLNREEHMAYIRYKKPDGTYIFTECIINDEGQIDVPLTQNMLAVAGISYCDFLITPKNTLTFISPGETPIDLDHGYISSMMICLNVVYMPMDGTDISSTDDFQVLEKIVREANKAIGKIDSAVNLAQNWAIGTPTGIRSDELVNNSKYWSDISKSGANTATSKANEATTAATNSQNYSNKAKEYRDELLNNKDEIIEEFNNAILESSEELKNIRQDIEQSQEDFEKIKSDVDGVVDTIRTVQEGFTPSFRVDTSNGHIYYELKPNS